MKNEVIIKRERDSKLLNIKKVESPVKFTKMIDHAITKGLKFF